VEIHGADISASVSDGRFWLVVAASAAVPVVY